MNSGVKRAEALARSALSALPSRIPLDGKSPLLLIVEDEIILRMVIADEMRKHGFLVFEAATGDEALMLLRTYPEVDVVFSDVRMPGSLDGVALAEIVARYYPRAKVFLTSAMKDRLTQDVGAAGFFPKPYSTDYVAAAIKKVCGCSLDSETE